MALIERYRVSVIWYIMQLVYHSPA